MLHLHFECLRMHSRMLYKCVCTKLTLTDAVPMSVAAYIPMSVASNNFISTLLDVNSPFQSLQTSLDLVSVLADLAQVPRKLYQVTIDCVSGLSATRQRTLAL